MLGRLNNKDKTVHLKTYFTMDSALGAYWFFNVARSCIVVVLSKHPRGPQGDLKLFKIT